MATVDIYVDPDASGAADGTSWADAYTSLSAAVSSEATDLVTAGDTHHYHCRSSAGTADTFTAAWTIGLDFGPYTTDATNRVVVEGDLDGGAWDVTKYRFVSTGNGTPLVSLNGCHVSLVKLQLDSPTAYIWNRHIEVDAGSGPSTLEVDSCYLRSAGPGSEQHSISIHSNTMSSSESLVAARNTIFKDIGGSAVYATWAASHEVSIVVDNCTAHNCASTAFLLSGDGSINIQNDVTIRNTFADGDCRIESTSSANITFESNAFTGVINSPPELTDWIDISGYTAAQIWVDAPNGDFSLVQSFDNPVVNGGTDLSAYFTEDITGYTIKRWDIGALNAQTITKDIYVDPDASGTADGSSWADAYTSLSAAVSNEATDLVSLDAIHYYRCRSSAGTNDVVPASAIYLQLYTTDASNYVIVEADDDHGGVWNDTQYICEITGNFRFFEWGSNGNIEIRGVQVYLNNSGYGGWFMSQGSHSGGSDVLIDSCIIKGAYPNDTDSKFGYLSSFADTDVLVIRNCLWFDIYDGPYINDYVSGGDASITLENNTAVNCGRYGWDMMRCDFAYNNVVFGCGTSGIGSSVIRDTASNNASDDSTHPGTNGVDLSLYTAAQIFVDAPNGDFHLAADSPLIGAGMDLSAEFTTDIDGEIRERWDIGADERWGDGVAYLGSVMVQDDTDAGGAIPLVIPAECDCITVAVTGYTGDTTGLLGDLSFVDEAFNRFTQIAAQVYTGYGVQVEALVMTAGSAHWPGAGAATLYWSPTTGSTSEGLNILVSFWGNVNPTSPIGDTQQRIQGQSWTSSLAGVGANDMGVVVAYQYTTNTMDVAVNGQAPLAYYNNFYDASIAAACEVGESALHIDSDGGGNVIPIAFSLTFDDGSGGGADHALTISDLTASAAVIESPVMGQAHGLAVAELAAGAPAIDQPTVGLAYALAVSDIATLRPGIDAITLTEDTSHDLAVSDIATLRPGIDAITLTEGTIYELAAVDVTTPRPAIEQLDLAQLHDATTRDMESGTPTVDGAGLTQTYALACADVTASRPVIDQPTIGTINEHALATSDIDSGTPALGQPTIQQAHSLAVAGVEVGVPVVDQPSMAVEGGLLTSDLIAGVPEITQPDLAQAHAIAVADVAAGAAVVDQPSLGLLVALDVADVAVGTPVVEQTELVVLSGFAVPDVVAGATSIDQPTMAQRHAFAIEELVAGVPQLGSVSVFDISVAEVVSLTATLTRSAAVTAALTRSVSLSATLREDR